MLCWFDLPNVREVTPATAEPVSVQFFKQHARIGGDETEPDDPESLVLPAYIQAARRHAERMTGQILTDAVYELRLRGLCSPISFPTSPVAAVSGVTYTDDAGDVLTLDPTQYTLDDHPWRPRLLAAYGATWPTGRVTADAVSVRFQGPYGPDTPIPADLQIAICLMAAHWYENREEVVVGGGASVVVPFAAQHILRLNQRDMGV